MAKYNGRAAIAQVNKKKKKVVYLWQTARL
jgi:hypothetical protein